MKRRVGTYKTEASFLEIYNETIKDLLGSPKEAKNLMYGIKLVGNKKDDSSITKLRVVPVLDETQDDKTTLGNGSHQYE